MAPSRHGVENKTTGAGVYIFFIPTAAIFLPIWHRHPYSLPTESTTAQEVLMDIVWLALLGAFFLLLVGLTFGCDRLIPRRK
jgi:hypothetical protein